MWPSLQENTKLKKEVCQDLCHALTWCVLHKQDNGSYRAEYVHNFIGHEDHSPSDSECSGRCLEYHQVKSTSAAWEMCPALQWSCRVEIVDYDPSKDMTKK